MRSLTDPTQIRPLIRFLGISFGRTIVPWSGAMAIVALPLLIFGFLKAMVGEVSVKINIRGNRVKKITDSKPTIVRKESPNIRKNGSFPPQKNPKDHMNLSTEAPATIRNKASGGGSRGKSYSPTRSLSEASESPGIELKATEPPPMTEKLYGLEPPPMPPGFSD